MGVPSRIRALRIVTRTLVLVMLSTFTGLAHAQNIPTQDLIKQITGKKATGANSSKVDESREESSDEKFVNEQLNPNQSMKAPTLKEFSPLELEFQNRAGQDALREKLIAAVQEARKAYAEGKSAGNEDDIRLMEQDLLQHFGHELFAASKITSGSYLGKIQENYTIGVGDDLIVNLVGNNASSSVVTVDREGMIVVEGLKPLSVVGRSFANVRDDLSRQVKSSMVGTELYLSMGGLRRLTVQVLGEVKQPGNMTVDSSADLLDVLIKSGGIKKTGSLRKIKIVANGKMRTVDLYDVLTGRDVDLSIANGIRVIVPLIGQTVAIQGKVLRPAIYELSDAGKMSLKGLIDLGGGTLRASGNLFRRSYISTNGRIKLASLKNRIESISPGDLISVNYDSWRPEKGVRVSGHVRFPQAFILSDKPTVSALLKHGEMLKDDAYPYFAAMRRQDAKTGKYGYSAINLAPIFDGVEDVNLIEGDELIVLASSDIQFLNGGDIRMALINPDANASKCKSLLPLIKDRASRKYSRIATLYGSDQIPDAEGFAEIEECVAIYEDNELLLPFVLEHVVALQGALRSSGLYPVVSSAPLSSLVAFAGGLTSNVDLQHVDSAVINDQAGFSLERRVYDFTVSSMNSVEAIPGSRFTFHTGDYDLEVGSITLQGEVKRPGVYAIKRGDYLSDVIKRAGGLTDNSYPYGSIFTRASVRELQRTNLRRSTNNIKQALAFAVLKKENVEISPEVVGLLLSNEDGVDVIGRMVVETDPDVLSARIELDIIVEPGDVLFVPSRPSYILLAGDVLNAGAMHFDPNKTIEDYIDQAGGLQVTADDDRVYVVYPNGIAEPISRSYWSKSNITLTPGTTIVVPKDLSPIDTMRLVRDVTGILGQLAVTIASIAVISNN